MKNAECGILLVLNDDLLELFRLSPEAGAWSAANRKRTPMRTDFESWDRRRVDRLAIVGLS
jgi:hypothetical protein